MIKFEHAISQGLARDGWAAQAIASLEHDLDASGAVHDVVEGWSQPGGDGAPLVDTLFVLTPDRLGLGTVAGPPRWVTLVDITAVDAVDDSPLPLQTIELELASGEVLGVGWPESFSDSLVDLLERLAAGHPTDDVATSDVFSATSLAEMSVDDAAPPTHKPIVAAIDFLNPAEEPAQAPVTDPVPEPETPAGMFAFDVAADPRLDAEPPSDAWFTVGAEDEAPPTAASFAEAPDLTMPAPAESSPAAPPQEPAVEPLPWLAPGMAWPDPVRGVVYLGGHPSHPRKRKNGTMRFSPLGLEVRGSGFHDWEMTMDWGYVDQLDVQGPDEVMFGDQLKIDSSSSAVIVVMNDGTRMVFEVRTRRPPSLRSAMAPVLLLVDNIRSWRAQLPRA